MRLTEFGDEQHEVIIMGQKIPDWFDGQDDAAVFSSSTGFNFVQVYVSSHGKLTADFGHQAVKEFRDAGTLETTMKKNRLTSFDGIHPYQPSK